MKTTTAKKQQWYISARIKDADFRKRWQKNRKSSKGKSLCSSPPLHLLCPRKRAGPQHSDRQRGYGELFRREGLSCLCQGGEGRLRTIGCPRQNPMGGSRMAAMALFRLVQGGRAPSQLHAGAGVGSAPCSVLRDEWGNGDETCHGSTAGTRGEAQDNNLPSARYGFESRPLQLNRCICCPSANPQQRLKCRSAEIMLFLSHYRPQPNKRALITQTIFYLLQGLLPHLPLCLCLETRSLSGASSSRK